MLFDFGGPGGSGVSILPRAAGSYGKLNARYDLVSFDPRGVAASVAGHGRHFQLLRPPPQRLEAAPGASPCAAARVRKAPTSGRGLPVQCVDQRTST